MEKDTEKYTEINKNLNRIFLLIKDEKTRKEGLIELYSKKFFGNAAKNDDGNFGNFNYFINIFEKNNIRMDNQSYWEIIQEATITIVEKIDTYYKSHSNYILPWITTIYINTAINYLKKYNKKDIFYIKKLNEIKKDIEKIKLNGSKSQIFDKNKELDKLESYNMPLMVNIDAIEDPLFDDSDKLSEEKLNCIAGVMLKFGDLYPKHAAVLSYRLYGIKMNDIAKILGSPSVGAIKSLVKIAKKNIEPLLKPCLEY